VRPARFAAIAAAALIAFGCAASPSAECICPEPSATVGEIAALKAAGLPPGVVEVNTADGPRLDAAGLVAEMLRRWKGVADYTAEIHSEEWVGSSNAPSVQAYVERTRLTPLSIHMRFLAGSDKDRQVVYVEGRNDGKMLIYPNPLPLIGFSKILRMSPDNPLAKARSNYDIRDSGVQGVMSGLPRAFRENSVSRWDLAGRVEFDGRPAWKLEGTDAENRPPIPNHMTMYVDAGTLLPVYFFGRRADGRPMTRMSARGIRTGIGLTDDDFDPRKLWP
jgi:hypothetical protein